MARRNGLAVARLLPVLLGVVVAASPASAQDGCEFGEEGNDVLRQVTMTGGEAIFYVTRPHLVCEGGIQIWADSAEAFTSTNLAHLIGSVRYEDPNRTLVADEARYFSQVGRLQAQGGMRIVDRDEGSTIENGALVYLRQTDFRDEETMTVTALDDESRPRATLSDASDAQPSGEERVYVVVGDRIESRGEDFLRSTGSVDLLFDSVVAHADTLEYEESIDRVDLRGNAVVNAPEYDLSGARVELTSPEPGRRDVRALGEAELTGEDFVLTAERIFLFASDDRMERLVALPAAIDTASKGAMGRPAAAPGAALPAPTAMTGQRPVAVAQSFEITADSLEILAPEERLERVFAAGRARSVSTGRDSLTVESLPDVARSDWLEGDTIVVTFVPKVETVVAAASDTVSAGAPSGVDVDRIVAIASARSLYRLPSSDPTAVAGVDPPAVHYVVGDRITIVMHDGDVDRMKVVGSTTGVHLEPIRPGGGGR
ncbi:MAG: hypothetical protein WEA34_12465 [Gemmatimonadota bacterium]